MHLLATYFKIIGLRFLGATQYKADFFIGISGLLIQQMVVVLVVVSIFSGVDELAGFGLFDVLFILGLAQLVRGLDLAYNDYIWVEAFGGFAQGSLYHYSIRPLPIYLQILSNRLNIQSLGPIGIGITLLCFSIPELPTVFTAADYALLVYFTTCGLLTMFAIKLIAASLALWFGRSGELMQVLHEFVEFIRYLMSIYALPLQLLLTFILPFGLISFVPALYWLPEVGWPLLDAFAVERSILLISYAGGYSLFFFCVSLCLWHFGLRHACVSGT